MILSVKKKAALFIITCKMKKVIGQFQINLLGSYEQINNLYYGNNWYFFGNFFADFLLFWLVIKSGFSTVYGIPNRREHLDGF